MRLAAVIPVLDERDGLAELLAAPDLRALAAIVIVVDGGSRDGSAELAREAGAVVIEERRRGYGRALHRGIEAARARGAEAIVFLDGSGASDPADLPALVGPILDGGADLVVGSRTRDAAAGALRPLQRLGNRFAVEVIARALGYRYTDVASLRAIRLDSLDALAITDEGSGWPLRLQIRAVRRRLLVREIRAAHRRRRGGASKVSGSVRGSIGAAMAMLRVLAAELVEGAR